LKVEIHGDVHFEYGMHNNVYQGEAYSLLMKNVTGNKPGALILLGDSGYGWTSQDWRSLVDITQVSAIYGNHDNIPLLSKIRNRDGMPVLASEGERREIGGLTFGFINGIIGHRMRQNIPRKTEEEFISLASDLRGVDVLCMHDTPFKDMRVNPYTHTKSAVYDAIMAAQPKFSFSGHMHIDYSLIEMSPITLHVNIDSSPKAQIYAVLDTEKMEVSLYHNLSKRPFLKHTHRIEEENGSLHARLLKRLRRTDTTQETNRAPARTMS
jgi:Icc-related predicted phosphoesterase